MEPEPVPQADDIEYRDYLVSVYRDVVAAPPYDTSREFGPPPIPGDRQARTLEILRRAFKQDFATTDQTVRPCNEVAAGVLRLVLIEDFDRSADSLPDRGGGTWREYLDTLIAATLRTRESLQRTYCLDLSRPDHVTTTVARQSIVTLQWHMRDDTNWTQNPLFLYKAEWRARFRTPFYPENHYELKTGLFASPSDRRAAVALAETVRRHKDFQQFSAVADAAKGMDLFVELDSHLTAGHVYVGREEFAAAGYEYGQAQRVIASLADHLTFTIHEVSADGEGICEHVVRPDTTSASAFRHSFEAGPLTPSWKQFGHRPDWYLPTPEAWRGDDGTWAKGLREGWWEPLSVPNEIPDHFPFTSGLFARFQWRYDGRAGVPSADPPGLAALEARNVVVVPNAAEESALDTLASALRGVHDDLISLIPHLIGLLIPISLGDLAEVQGDAPRAATTYASVLPERLCRALLTTEPTAVPTHDPSGDLPWTWLAGAGAGAGYPYLHPSCEGAYLQLRLGALYLDWADRLYRVDREPQVFRARELYKAVLGLYGLPALPSPGLQPVPWVMANRSTLTGRSAVLTHNLGTAVTRASTVAEERLRARAGRPGTAQPVPAPIPGPALPEPVAALWDPIIRAGVAPTELAQAEPQDAPAEFTLMRVAYLAIALAANPAMLAQQMRARLGLSMIDAGLNHAGFTHEAVPMLRYRPLAAAASVSVTRAAAARRDLLTYRQRAESEEMGLLHGQLAVAAGTVRAQVEAERVAQAEDQIVIADHQLELVNAAIAAKKAEIADHDSVCGQVKDAFSGIAGFLSGVPGPAAAYVKSDYAAAFGFGGKASSGTAAAGAGGLGVVGGMAAFAVAAGVTLSGMADAANRRAAELRQMQSGDLPAAVANLDMRQRELVIAQAQRGIALLEVAVVEQALRFAALKALNLDLWNKLAVAIRRTMHRYLELATTAAWLAERALAYEQDRNIRSIRFDYAAAGPDGLLGPDALNEDLTALEHEYLLGTAATSPVVWEVSLARDFPLEFGQLKATGRCLVTTTADALEVAHPGSYSHRIRAVEVASVHLVTDPRPVGMLHNAGVSIVRGRTHEDDHLSLRPPGTLPLSGFDLHADAGLYGIPSEATLMPFEGSGIDTTWLLELPPGANPSGLGRLADVVLRFHLLTRFSGDRRDELVRAGTQHAHRTVVFSAARVFPTQLGTFLSSANALTMPIAEALLPAGDRATQVVNVAVGFVGDELREVRGQLSNTAHPTPVDFTSDGLLAHSRNQTGRRPRPPVAASPLDELATGGATQTWILDLPPEVGRAGIHDVLLAIEYRYEVPPPSS